MGDVDCGALLRFPALALTSAQGGDESVMLPISSYQGEYGRGRRDATPPW